MTDWYAPNQQAVGIEPASATVAPTAKKAEPAKTSKTSKAKAEDDDE